MLPGLPPPLPVCHRTLGQASRRGHPSQRESGKNSGLPYRSEDTRHVELFGTPGTPLDGLGLIIVEGDAGATAGTSDRRIDSRPFQRIGPNGAFLIGNCKGLAENYGVIPDKSIASNFLANNSFTAAIVETASRQDGVASGAEVVLNDVALGDLNADANGDQFFFGALVSGIGSPTGLDGSGLGGRRTPRRLTGLVSGAERAWAAAAPDDSIVAERQEIAGLAPLAAAHPDLATTAPPMEIAKHNPREVLIDQATGQ